MRKEDINEKLYNQLKHIYDQYSDEWTEHNQKETADLLRNYDEINKRSNDALSAAITTIIRRNDIDKDILNIMFTKTY